MLFKEGYLNIPLKLEIPVTLTEFKLGLMFRESLDEDCGMLFVFEESSEKSFHMNHTQIPLDIAFINASGIVESIKELQPLNPVPVYSDAEVLYALEVNRGWFAENNVNIGDQILNTLSEDVEVLDANGNLYATVIDLIKPEPMKVPKSNIYYEDPLKEATRLPGYNKVGNIIHVYLAWRGKNYMLQMFFPHVKTPSRREVQDQVRKVYPGAKLWNYQVSNHDPGEPLLQAGG
jgi:uncharacterized membrane protein (UPF0127 family)|tara:strand:- start:85 stop:783 length:699 start_codon:yes stop_codon:yes gene_type:complete